MTPKEYYPEQYNQQQTTNSGGGAVIPGQADVEGNFAGRDQHNTYNSTVVYLGDALEQASRRVPAPRHHQFLPCLLNRDEQIFQLSQSLNTRRENKTPLLCLIYGSAQECHSLFTNRLVRSNLRDLITLDAPTIKRCPLDLRIHSDNLYENLRYQLTNYVDCEKSASTATINDCFATYGAPVFIETHLLVDGQNSRWQEYVKQYLHFWTEWPELQTGQLLIVAFCIQYTETKQSLWRKFWSRKHGNPLSNTVTQRLQQLHAEYDGRIQCELLPELRPIGLQEAINWTMQNDVSDCCSSHHLGREIRALFKDNRAIPMEVLHDHLSEILKRFSEF